MRLQVLTRDGEHASCACGGVVDGADDARLRQRIIIFDEEQVCHEADDVARCEVVTGGLIRLLCKLADKLLEDGAHVGV